jgi:hypothetical protein
VEDHRRIIVLVLVFFQFQHIIVSVLYSPVRTANVGLGFPDVLGGATSFWEGRVGGDGAHVSRGILRCSDVPLLTFEYYFDCNVKVMCF